ncbi:MAG: hypothetical protein R3F60_10250 [bacterium]
MGTSCGEGGACVPQPQAVSVGDVSVAGLLGPVAMTASAGLVLHLPGQPAAPGLRGRRRHRAGRHRHRGRRRLHPAGPGRRSPGRGRCRGGAGGGEPFALRWQAAADGRAGRVHVDLNIANHGGTPARIECTVDDTGAFTVPQALTDALLALGASGFPR